LNFANLPIQFKQEVPSPPNQNQDGLKTPRSPNAPQFARIHSPTGCVRQHQMGSGGLMSGAGGNLQSNDQQQATGSSASSNGLSNFLDQFASGNQGNENNESSNGQGPHSHTSNDEFRFQYVLAAATSIATKSNEDTLTYLNQGQSYEIKLKKLGDLSTCRGKMMKSVVKICFHERRLQYMEREQMHIWQSSRPGERILDIDIPLSYGLIHVNQTALLNTAEIMWDPMKEVGVYIKVNCISTEFTPKKHGGEKGVPFRIQVETFFEGVNESQVKPLHAAACQIKVSSSTCSSFLDTHLNLFLRYSN
jgi:transcription factor CP2 and related proteins